jgi:transcriptional activator of cad operon
MPKVANTIFQLGDLRVYPSLDEIRKDGVSIKLEPRTMLLLVCLAERPGQVVSVDELLDLVWKDVVVSPDSLYQAMYVGSLASSPRARLSVANTACVRILIARSG